MGTSTAGMSLGRIWRQRASRETADAGSPVGLKGEKWFLAVNTPRAEMYRSRLGRPSMRRPPASSTNLIEFRRAIEHPEAIPRTAGDRRRLRSQQTSNSGSLAHGRTWREIGASPRPAARMPERKMEVGEEILGKNAQIFPNRATQYQQLTKGLLGILPKTP